MVSRILESLSNAEGEVHLASFICKRDFAGPEWKQALASQENLEKSDSKKQKKLKDDHDGRTEL